MIIARALDGLIISWNPAAERMFGYTAPEVIGRKMEALIPLDRVDEEAEVLGRVGRGETFQNLETVRRRKDGTLVEVSLTVSPVYDEGGRVIAASKIARDVTAQRRAYRQMTEALLEITQLKDALDEHALLEVTNIDGAIIYANDKFCEVSKYAREDLIGQNHRLVNSGHHSKVFFEELWRTIAEGKVWKGEVKNRAKDGSTYWVQTTIVPSLDANGKPRRYVVIRTDITEQKLAAEALMKQGEEQERAKMSYREQAGVLQRILNSIADGVIVANADGKAVLFNEPAEVMLGLGPVETPPERWSEEYGIFLPDMVTPYPPRDLPLARAIRGEAVDHAEVFVRNAKRPEGVWLSAWARPLHEEHKGASAGILVIRDISDAKRAEKAAQTALEAEAANRAKSEFLSRMSHELRTPLNAILGFAQILELDNLPEDHRESVDQILKGGRHLLTLVDEVLDIARIESGRLTLSTEPVLAHEAVETAVSLIQPLAAQKGILLRIQPSPCWREYVLADRPRLQQVLLNLLSNAVKYNLEGGRVTVSGAYSRPGRLRLEVRDTGTGIPAGKVGLLFRPFERLGAESTGIQGTGIGLVLSRRLAEAMGGTLDFETEVGVGSTFWVELPLHEDPITAYDRLAGSRPFEAPVCVPEAKVILYVEDNPSNTLLMERILANRSDIKLVSAGQGRLGVELAHHHQPRLILLDLHLPDLPGDEVLRVLQADPQTAHIPVAMITADAMPAQGVRLRAAGAQAFFSKPLDVKELLRFIDETLGIEVP
ncbi:MAG: PAS domain S-box protein [Acidobacteriia bacterium]|nr:PAS domain S-box protein [Terriglobia bacterium]